MEKIIQKITCQTPLNKVSGRFPYQWDLNIYRGCEHACQYCYAIYSHRYLQSEQFFNHIFIKENIVETLERKLSSPYWKQEIINIGGVTDSYQPVETECKLMPDILKLLIRHKTPAIISTKSDLILRDYDLIDQLSKITYVNIATTITTLDDTQQILLEPNASSPQSRLNILKAFKETNASVGLHVMPIIPYLTDSTDNLNALFEAAHHSQVDYVLPGILYLRGNTRPAFFNFIKERFPSLYSPLVSLYQKGSADKTYQTKLYQKVYSLLHFHHLSTDYKKQIIHKMPCQQYALFP